MPVSKSQTFVTDMTKKSLWPGALRGLLSNANMIYVTKEATDLKLKEKRMAEINAVVYYGENDFFIGISPGGHSSIMETNGDRASAATPIELLLIAVGGCMASDVVDILRKKREKVTNYRIEVTGQRRDDFPRSFNSIKLHHVIKGDSLSEIAVKQAIELANSKYCSVAATLRPTAEVSVTFEVLQESLVSVANRSLTIETTQ
jgi:putative redox protein